MNVAMIGCGKLGLPVSVTIAIKGHTVLAYDKDEEKMDKYRDGVPDTGSYEPNLDKQLRKALDSGNLHLCTSLRDMWLDEPEIIFVAVPTPSKEDASFNTAYIKSVLADINIISQTMRKKPIVAIISTILPMTTRTEFASLTSLPIVYNPFFIAMGVVVIDYLEPEFVLLGYHENEYPWVHDKMVEFYESIYRDEKVQPPILSMTWEEAECTKVLYNTIIGFKIVIGNSIMEMCHSIPYANCDTIVNAFKYATKRIIGSTYLTGGMGDGGECHPRDNRALSYLCKQLNLSTNAFKFIMDSRDLQAGWLAYLMLKTELPGVIIGKRFKSNSNLTTDSASILVYDIAESLGVDVNYHDPVLGIEYYPSSPHVFLVAIHEPWAISYPYPEGSVVLDVWRQFTEKAIEHLKNTGVEYISVGGR